MPYREVHDERYSLAKISGELLEACVVLTRELLLCDWPPPFDEIEQLLETAGAPEGFLPALEGSLAEVAEETGGDAGRGRRVPEAIAMLREREEREDVYAFLLDLVSLRMINQVERDLLDRLADIWRLV
jgi:hypothetical protein